MNTGTSCSGAEDASADALRAQEAIEKIVLVRNEKHFTDAENASIRTDAYALLLTEAEARPDAGPETSPTMSLSDGRAPSGPGP